MEPGSVPTSLQLAVDATHDVAMIWQQPAGAWATFVFAHGAGAGMQHAFMATVADELGERGIATLRYQFPYMDRGSRRPDPPPLCHATVRAAVAAARQRKADGPLLAGGKSFGARMTSQAEALTPLGVDGLVFLGFPLHPAGKPADARGAHLADVGVPMLFLQGTRDALADHALVRGLVARLGESAALVSIEGADHSFHVPARSGRSDAQVRSDMLDELASWTRRLAQRRP
jgi:predicted alpha/beta-hydrolase family hydrolase